MSTTPRAICTALLIALGVAGCASAGPATQAGRAAVGSTTSPTPAIPPVSGLCPTGISRLKLQRLPAGFEPAIAYLCSQDVETVPGRGRWSVDVEQRATRDLGPLVSALGKPDEPATGDLVCPATVVLAPQIVLEDANGTLLRPAIPTDGCGQPQTDVSRAVRSMAWHTISRRLVQQVETQSEVNTGCAGAYKDLFDLDAFNLQPAPPGPAISGRPKSITVCVFRDDPATNHPDGPNGPGSDTPVGSFVGGGKVTGSMETTLLVGISGGRSSAGCPVTHPEFAVIWAAGGQPNTLVELGGCNRVLKISYLVNKATRVATEHDVIGQANTEAEAVIAAVAGR